MICSNCGNEFYEGSVCPVCGQAVEEIAPETVTTDPGKTLGIIALVLGIVSLVLGTVCNCFFGCLGGLVPAAIAIAGIVCGALGMKKSKEAGFSNKLALVGLILSIATFVVAFVIFIINAILGAAGAVLPAFFEGTY